MNYKHGKNKIPEFRIWQNMLNRCYNEKDSSFSHYGARGITVCPEWRDSFEQFITDMGPRPSNDHSVDRINNNKGYSKENCRWATGNEQMQNRRKFNNSASKYRGVLKNSKVKKNAWRAIIGFNNRSIYLGGYPTEEEAAKAYDSVAIKLYGEKANLNFK